MRGDSKNKPHQPDKSASSVGHKHGRCPSSDGETRYLLFPPTGQKHGLRSWHSSLQGPAAFVAHRVKPMFATLAFHIGVPGGVLGASPVIQLPANDPEKAAENDPSTWVPYPPVGRSP